jgi:hypothetical protein
LRNPGLWTIAIDFIFGTAIDVDMWGDISNSVTAFACVRPSGCQSTSNIFSTVDFGHTMFWGGITSLTDANGNPVDNYTLTSLSGFDYRFAAVPAAAVPSPSTVLLFMTGLPLLLASRTRRSPSHATS